MIKTDGILDIKTVHQCNCCLGSKTLHPQVSVIELDGNTDVAQNGIKFDFYTVLLIDRYDGMHCKCCGMRHYDYSEASMVFLSPEKAFDMTHDHVLPSKGWLLAFHPDLLYGTTLNHTLCNYTFFAYSKEEALHLSLREKNKIICCLKGIDEELHHPIDGHSRIIITRHIELLLDYCKRYYERQFITREDKNSALMAQLSNLVEDYILQGKMADGVFPTSEMCALNLGLSVQYFKDLLQFYSGKALREYVELKRIGLAKNMLMKCDYSVSRIVTELGYPSVRQFNMLFKRLTGFLPQDYKVAQN